MITEECRILESVNYERWTHTPAAWIHVFQQRLYLWCQQQPQLSQRPLFSLVPLDMLARGAQDIADVYVFEPPFTMGWRASHVGRIGMISLVRVLDLFPSGQSLL